MKIFEIPELYKSKIISAVKTFRKELDPRKKNYKPTVLDFGPVKFLIARHFGFCYGVENAIEIAYKTIAENSNKRIFLLSEMIHNPDVNADLKSNGVQFLMDTKGNNLISFQELNSNDIVIVPAFGTTLEIQDELKFRGINTYQYDTTCPFVEKVWNRAAEIGKKNYTIVIHGKPSHEETRATFSHSKENAASIVVKDKDQAILLGSYILGKKNLNEFWEIFTDQVSAGFDPEIHLQKVGVVNQTTMLAEETTWISNYLKDILVQKYGHENSKIHFADTRDTLCYATNDNQTAVANLLLEESDICIVAGGYNSSNTTHLVELAEPILPTFFINSAQKISFSNELNITSFNIHTNQEIEIINFLPKKETITISLVSGASCPDAILEGIIEKIISNFENLKTMKIMEIATL